MTHFHAGPDDFPLCKSMAMPAHPERYSTSGVGVAHAPCRNTVIPLRR